MSLPDREEGRREVFGELDVVEVPDGRRGTIVELVATVEFANDYGETVELVDVRAHETRLITSFLVVPSSVARDLAEALEPLAKQGHSVSESEDGLWLLRRSDILAARAVLVRFKESLGEGQDGV